jgi:hypothetical protein
VSLLTEWKDTLTNWKDSLTGRNRRLQNGLCLFTVFQFRISLRPGQQVLLLQVLPGLQAVLLLVLLALSGVLMAQLYYLVPPVFILPGVSLVQECYLALIQMLFKQDFVVSIVAGLVQRPLPKV